MNDVLELKYDCINFIGTTRKSDNLYKLPCVKSDSRDYIMLMSSFITYLKDIGNEIDVDEYLKNININLILYNNLVFSFKFVSSVYNGDKVKFYLYSCTYTLYDAVKNEDVVYVENLKIINDSNSIINNNF